MLAPRPASRRSVSFVPTPPWRPRTAVEPRRGVGLASAACRGPMPAPSVVRPAAWSVLTIINVVRTDTGHRGAVAPRRLEPTIPPHDRRRTPWASSTSSRAN